jgi:hypothetical protein
MQPVTKPRFKPIPQSMLNDKTQVDNTDQKQMKNDKQPASANQHDQTARKTTTREQWQQSIRSRIRFWNERK